MTPADARLQLGGMGRLQDLQVYDVRTFHDTEIDRLAAQPGQCLHVRQTHVTQPFHLAAEIDHADDSNIDAIQIARRVVNDHTGRFQRAQVPEHSGLGQADAQRNLLQRLRLRELAHAFQHFDRLQQRLDDIAGHRVDWFTCWVTHTVIDRSRYGRQPPPVKPIGAHFIAGGVLLLLGPVQLIGGVRRNFPALHRWAGRVYVLAAGLAGLGGLGFILGQGTIGGSLMDVGFGIYGALMIVCATQAYVHARARRYEQHRAWAIRLFALTIGSWLYRMEYAFWFLLTGGLGRTSDLTGRFDAIMVFFFYVPNLIIAELFIRARRKDRGAAASLGAATLILAASAFVIVATWSFTVRAWGPGMIRGATQLFGGVVTPALEISP